MKKVLVIGAGFGGLEIPRKLGRRWRKPDFEVTVIDRANHHVFQPLLYQVATAGLSPADIAYPIRSIFAGFPNVTVLQDEVISIDRAQKKVTLASDIPDIAYDLLVVAAGARHHYFSNDEWEEHAPGLKTIEQATEIRRRIFHAFECAEREPDPDRRRDWMSFVVVGGGPTGVELAGALGEITRFSLSRDFRRIDPRQARLFLIEAAPRILSSFDERLSRRAQRDLETLGVQVWTSCRVNKIDGGGVLIGSERISARTVLWAAGVQGSPLGRELGVEPTSNGQIPVSPTLELAGDPSVFVIGDLAHFEQDGAPLPGVSPVAIQQGQYVGERI